MKCKFIPFIFFTTCLFILPVLSWNAYAQSNATKYFGDWQVIISSDGNDLIAGTYNQAGNYVGFRCFSSNKQCVHAIGADINCKDGDIYPILINSDVSALTMEAVCVKNGSNHELALTKYDAIHEILMKGSNIGFAIPMENGTFKAVRFSLKGSDKAMNYVEVTTANLDDGESYF